MKLYNTLTNKLEEFIPIDKNMVKMYVCGPTVYNYIHIGNTRPIVVFDVLARYLKYTGYNVKYVQNFTDIDDKIIKKANEDSISIEKVTTKYINAFMEDTSKLNLLDDIIRPKVTDNMNEIIQMIQKLIDNGYAYQKDKDVLFSISKFKDYGKLSNQKLDELNSGVRIEVDNNKENVFDFVLWKAQKENEPYYESPFGHGRPGWHIECSAMIKKYLGDNIDIHAGGQDLIFPHHENERAQSICEMNEKSFFVKYWLHNAYVTLNSEKMSKSTGNFMLLREALEKFDGNVIRYFILTSHYRKSQNFSIDELENSKKTLNNINKNLIKFSEYKGDNHCIDIENDNELSNIIKEFEKEFINALEDDLNTPKALSTISIAINKTNKLLNKDSGLNYNLMAITIKKYLEEILGVKMLEKEVDDNTEKIVEILLNVRDKLRETKNYELSDYIRDELNKLNININDKKKG
ncbi:cysteine--tRNA ligase [Oceanivirga salmonicida]|uniref:cysteine--tRNA ligase n=1 Tax=Oceanivirga salmonicida TaxID=1769291 RepID=UPI0008324994|nr:cysteine--tRNA ligase [Oceanivirga salmonicida]